MIHLPTLTPLCRVDDLTVEYSHFTLGPVHLDLSAGEVFCLVGPNGSGKTTLISALLGLVAHSGSASIDGQESRGRDPGVLREVGYVPDDTAEVIPELTAPEWWELHALSHARIRGSMAAMLADADALAEHLDFAPPPAPMSSFSHGMLKKTQLVAGLLHDPQVAILDEPRNGLDPIAIERLERLIVDLRRRQRLVLLATHDLRFAERMADRVAILDRGRVVSVGSPASLVEPGEAGFAEAFFRIVG